MRKATLYILGLLGALLLGGSCASMGTPSGGPRDEDPPRFLYSNPPQGSTEVSPSRAMLFFNELVNVKDAFSKVVVSPPSATTPRVSSLGRRVTVEFRDTLMPNTTYTVDFGDAIVDNNEGNKLENFFYTFSTGPELDTLMVSGMVFDALELEPSAGIYVGLHINPEDSAFTRTRFDRIAKTDENGRFFIGGLPEGQYRIYALDDRDGDMAWSSPEETLAFYDAVIEPRVEAAVAIDTIFNLKTGDVDSIVNRSRYKYFPNNILLRSYNTGYKQQYITKYERVDSTRINFIFNAPADSMPVAEIVIPDAPSIPLSQVSVTERSAGNDTIFFWLRDREIIGRDTLRVAMTYFRADSAYNMVPVNDTLRLLTQRPVARESKVKKPEKKEQTDTVSPPEPRIQFKALNSKPEVNSPLILELPSPPETIDYSAFRMEFKEDSVWLPDKEFDIGMIRPDSLNPRRLMIDYPWEYTTTYKLSVDSLAAKDIYGVFTDAYNLEITTRGESEYGSLKFNLYNWGTDSIPRFVDLLDGQGKAVRSMPVADGSVTFEYLLPGKYNARVVEDANGNGRWDPGIFELKIQPDVSYYYPETIELKQNWSQELDWNVFGTPVDRMKPESLRKNKPKR